MLINSGYKKPPIFFFHLSNSLDKLTFRFAKLSSLRYWPFEWQSGRAGDENERCGLRDDESGKFSLPGTISPPVHLALCLRSWLRLMSPCWTEPISSKPATRISSVWSGRPGSPPRMNSWAMLFPARQVGGQLPAALSESAFCLLVQGMTSNTASGAHHRKGEPTHHWNLLLLLLLVIFKKKEKKMEFKFTFLQTQPRQGRRAFDEILSLQCLFSPPPGNYLKLLVLLICN